MTVAIHSDDALLWSDTPAISGEDSYTSFATITFPDDVVTSL